MPQPKPEKIIQSLEDVIADALDRFHDRLPRVEKDMYAKVLELASELDTYPDGRIKASVRNVKIIGRIKTELNKVILNSPYSKDVKAIVDTYDKVTALQNSYFTSLVGTFTAPKVAEEIRQLSIDNVVESLGRNALDVNITQPIRAILTQSVTTGGTRAELTETVRAFLLESDKGKGALTRYAKTLTTDALNQYSANYNTIISDDLGFEWFKYSGSLRETSRDFCRVLIDASRSGGCMEYIHQSQIPALLDGHICGDDVDIYDKTGLPQGMVDGTNESNFKVLRGGYNCNHQLIGVPSAIVPKRLRDQYK